MNLVEFLTRVDEISDTFSKDDLRYFIHTYAKALPEKKRSSFLEILNEVSDDVVDQVKHDNFAEEDQSLFIFEADQMKDYLGFINKGDYYIIKEFDGYEESFKADSLITSTIFKSAELIINLVESGLFSEALELFDTLVNTKFYVSSEYDDDVISFDNLDGYLWKAPDFEDLVIPAVHAVYKTYPLEQRLPRIIRVLSSLESRDFNFEDLLRKEKYEDFDEFLNYAIDYLGNKPGSKEKELLRKAITYKNDTDLLIKKAEEFVENHPELYLDILDDDDISNQLKIELGLKALEKIDKKLKIRSSIASQVAQLAAVENQKDLADECLLEAFISKPSAAVYLTNLYSGEDKSKLKDKMDQFIKGLKNDNPYLSREDYESGIYYLSDDEMSVLEFLTGDIKDFFENKLEKENIDDWRYFFTREALAIFLMYLNTDDEIYYTSLIIEDFSKKAFKYKNQMEEPDHSFKDDHFIEAFNIWKNLTKREEKEGALEYIEKIKNLMQSRVKRIMKKDKRDLYEECSQFIGAIGDVEESLGVPEAKKELIDYYRNTYPRRKKFMRYLDTVEI